MGIDSGDPERAPSKIVSLLERALLFFGLFTLVYGVRLLVGSSISLMAGVPQMVGWRENREPAILRT